MQQLRLLILAAAIAVPTAARAEGNNSGQSQTLSAGGATTCFINSGTNTTYGQGRLYCWGRNDHGQIGDGTTTDRTTPVQVGGALRFATVSVGSRHTCAIQATTGALYCWGANQDRQLGNPALAATDFNTPQFITAGAWYGVSAGDVATCGIIYGPGELWCWGNYLTFGQAGVTQTSPTLVAKPSGVGGFYSVSVGFNSACMTFINPAGTEYGIACFGQNNFGQVGNRNSLPQIATPTIIHGTLHTSWGYTAVCDVGGLPCNASGINTANEGGLWSSSGYSYPWGFGVSVGNQFACATPYQSYYTGQIARPATCWGFGKWSSTASSLGYNVGCPVGDSTCANCIWTGGSLCTGGNTPNYSIAQLPVDMTYTSPIPPGQEKRCNPNQPLHSGPWPCQPKFGLIDKRLDNINFIAGGQHSCGYVRAEGFTVAYLFCWGRNNFGQLGIGNTTDKTFPAFVSTAPTLTNPTPNEAGLALGAEHTCALNTTGSTYEVRCWGHNNLGRLGTGGTQDGTAHPTPAIALSQPRS